MPLPIKSASSDQVMQVSKSRKLPLLIAPNEMQALFTALGHFEIFDASRPITEDGATISKEDFISQYAQYVKGIQTGNLVDEAFLRPYFSAILTTTPDILYAVPLANGKYLIKAKRPVIQLQRHHFIISNQFHLGVMGEGSVTWGVQFSYPQLFLDPQTNQIGKVEKNSFFPNTELFQTLAKWVRNYTRATPFIYQEKQINQPLRLGKECFDWINNHPTLKEKSLYVPNPKNTPVSH